jgi:Superfamily II DNA and RNA helicases
MITFEGLGLDSKLIQATDALGFKNPTPIQEKAIPVLLSGQRTLLVLHKQALAKQLHLVCHFFN